MTLLATLALFSVALTAVWLATGRRHECSCGRSHRILAEYERTHSRSQRAMPNEDQQAIVLIPSSAIVRNAKLP
jgi:hypothetical protein